MRLLAAQTNLGPPLGGIGPLGNTSGFFLPFQTFETTLSTVVGVLTIAGGLWFMFQIFGGSLQWLSSGGDKQALENARKRLTHAVIGLLMVILSYGFILLIGSIFGLNILSPALTILTQIP